MKQVININFHGQVVPIEVTAFDLLKTYTASLSRYFADEEGKEEIINDIESRIGELFQERLKKGATCITEDDVNAIIRSMGTIDDFDIDEEKVNKAENKSSNSSQQTSATPPLSKRLYRDENNKILGGVCGGLANYFNTDPLIIRILFVVISLAFGTGILAYIILWVAVPSTASAVIGGTRKKLFRDPDDKVVAGVCSGIGNYFGISPWIPRLLFLLPFLSFLFRFIGHWGFWDDFFNFSFSPGSLIIYIILWLAFPEASTTAEKLEMKGEKVDMNSIKNSVVEEMKGVQKRAEKFGQEAKTIAEEKGKQLGAEVRMVAKKNSHSLGDFIAVMVKAFAYFIMAIVGFALVVLLFGIAVVSIGIFPAKNFLLSDGWQNALAWGTLIFFIAVPVIGVITWIIRRLTKMKSNRKVLRASFISLWVIGWACVVCLIASVAKDFRNGNTLFEQEVALQNPGVQKLEITNSSPNTKFLNSRWLRFEPFDGIDEDSALVNNVQIKILKSPNDSFKVTIIKLARGSNRRNADTLARKISFNAVQQSDSILLLDRGFQVNRTDKFRNQRILMVVYVPVGKQIKIAEGVGNGFNINFGSDWDENVANIDWHEENNWDHGVTYVMKANGLYTLDGVTADEWRSSDHGKVKIGPDGIEVRDGKTKVTIDGNGVQVDDNYRYDDKNPLNKADSLKRTLEIEQRRVKDSLEKVKEKIEQQLEKIGDKSTEREEAMTYNTMLMMTPITSYL